MTDHRSIEVIDSAIRRIEDLARIAVSAKLLLAKLDKITTAQFSIGGDRAEREQLRADLARVEGLP